MNSIPIMGQAFKLWWAIPMFLAIVILKTPWFKGVIGEAAVKFAARLRLPKASYHPIHNVTLTTVDGSTQVDHIFVSRFGIFVVETKNMKGWIYGRENQAEWTQKIFKKSFKFQNPLRQNYKHTQALEALLDVPPEAIHSVIVFAGSSTFKSPMPANVTQAGGYIRYIKSFNQPILSEAQVQSAIAKIQSGRLQPTWATHRQHVQQLKKRKAPATERPCPKCGSNMVLRTAQRGKHAGQSFWACTAYPQCKTVQSAAGGASNGTPEVTGNKKP